MTDLEELRERLNREKIAKENLEKEIDALTIRSHYLETEVRETEIAQAIIQKVAKETQQELEYHISELCSLALSAVFDDPYELSIEFNDRRGRTEADIDFIKDGEPIGKPLLSSGGGALDVAAFGLRVALWSLSRPKTRNVLILDEPFRHLKGDEANRRAITMVKEISNHLGLQIIMISDERVKQEDIVNGADRVFMVNLKKKYFKSIKMNKGVSQVKVL